MQQLVAAIPGLGQRAVSQVPLVEELLAAAGLAAGDRSLGEILAENPLVGNWQLNGIDLSQFPIFALSLFVGKAPILLVRFRFWITAAMIGFFWEGRDSWGKDNI